MRTAAACVLAAVFVILGWMGLVDAVMWEVEHRREQVGSRN